jgi:hypothetical protein
MSRHVPALADPPFTPPPEVIDEGRRQLRLPIANRLIAEFDAPDQEHLWQIAQAQLVAKPQTITSAMTSDGY